MVPKIAIDTIKSFEGFRAEAYPDPMAGWQLPTIGYGATRYPDGKPVRKGDRIGQASAEQCLATLLEHEYRPALERIPAWAQMNPNQQAALYSFAYNLGAQFYRGSRFASITQVCDSPQRWNDRDWITEQFIKYRNPGSSAEKGLRRRREAEAKLFLTPVAG